MEFEIWNLDITLVPVIVFNSSWKKTLKYKQRVGHHINDGHLLGLKYRFNRSNFLNLQYFSCALFFKLDEFYG